MVEDVVDVGVRERERPAVATGRTAEGTLRYDRTDGLLVINDGAHGCG
ncbi:unannotated protein [freshwater metagenome]|uniref:Unannotated protein n=1 Tax=freshwater metagenome TaxID=449393 RepID=A0A6J6M036_9ZZZZ